MLVLVRGRYVQRLCLSVVSRYLQYTPAQVAVGTQVVMVVVEGEVKVAVVHFSVRTQASAVPHPPVGQAAASVWWKMWLVGWGLI